MDFLLVYQINLPSKPPWKFLKCTWKELCPFFKEPDVMVKVVDLLLQILDVLLPAGSSARVCGGHENRPHNFLIHFGQRPVKQGNHINEWTNVVLHLRWKYIQMRSAHYPSPKFTFRKTRPGWMRLSYTWKTYLKTKCRCTCGLAGWWIIQWAKCGASATMDENPIMHHIHQFYRQLFASNAYRVEYSAL